jgi:nucleoside 2-deoxyribosyltransferase
MDAGKGERETLSSRIGTAKTPRAAKGIPKQEAESARSRGGREVRAPCDPLGLKGYACSGTMYLLPTVCGEGVFDMGAKTDTCLLCDRECETERYPNAEIYWFRCPSCGDFSATSATGVVHEWSEIDRAKLSACTRERGIHDLSPLVLHHGTSDIAVVQELCPSRSVRDVDELLASVFPHRIQDRLDRVLANLCALTASPGNLVELRPQIDVPVVMAETAHAAEFILNEMMALKYVYFCPSAASWQLRVKAAGIQRAQELESSSLREKSLQAFVAMWFCDDTVQAYSQGIDLAIRECGFSPRRIDLKETNQKVCDEIIADIRRSRFMVADFTGQRGGVYYEAGFAQGLGIPVIWTCKKGGEKKLHFDTRQYNHILWETPEELRGKLTARIRATIPGAK